MNRSRLHKDRRAGFSIIELLVSMVILMFVSLALMQTALVNISVNTRNALRNEGTRVASMTMDAMRNVSYTQLGTIFNGTTTNTVNRGIRNTDVPYAVTNTVAAINDNNKRIDVRVEWGWKGVMYNTTISTIRTNLQ